MATDSALSPTSQAPVRTSFDEWKDEMLLRESAVGEVREMVRQAFDELVRLVCDLSLAEFESFGNVMSGKPCDHCCPCDHVQVLARRSLVEINSRGRCAPSITGLILYRAYCQTLADLINEGLSKPFVTA
jgi:hypothetical protein